MMKTFQAAMLVVLLSTSLVGLSACNRGPDARESYIREAAPDRTQLDREEQQSYMREDASDIDIEGESTYVRDGDESFTGENKGVGYEQGTD